MNHKRYFIFSVAAAAILGAIQSFGQTITDFTPTFGQPGTYVIINGAGFIANVTKVRFHGVLSAATVTSSSQIQAPVPSGMTPGPISVQNGNNPAYYSSVNFTNIGAGPFISDFTPYSGRAGTEVTINGANFDGATSVKFSGVNASFIPPTSYTQIKATAPNNVVSGPITITTPKGTYTSISPFYAQPSITSFAPTNGRAGTTVKITGKNFIGTSQVDFNGIPAWFTNDSNTQITTVVPINATRGVITVTTPAMPVPSAVLFTVPPVITGFSPAFGPVGTAVTITGSNLKIGTTTVQFNGTNATPTVLSSNQIVVPVPANASSGPITVSNTDGSDRTAGNFLLPPNITGVTPARGLPGTTVTINGSNFTNATAVKFKGMSATFTVVSNNKVTAIVPAGASTGVLTLTTPADTATNLVFGIPPVIFGFSPAFGFVGDNVTISGSFPDGATKVQFGGATAAFTVTGTNLITATVPTNAPTGPITVIGLGGTNQSTTNFRVDVPVLPPQIFSVFPEFGPVGTLVTISGTNLNIGTTTVKFNGTNAAPLTVAATQITVKVPEGASSGLITVTTRDGAAATTNNFLLPPVISGFTPASGQPGVAVTINGTNFTNATAIRFHDSSAPGFIVVNNNKITTTVPVGASSGPVSLITPAGTNFSSGIFSVPPIINGFAPTSGVPGTSVVISGSFPDGVTNVFFNGVSALTTLASASQITAIVPTNATTGLITVNALGGTDQSATSFKVIIPILPPVISSFSPAGGPVGTVVTITGSNLNVGGITVKFNNTAATLTSITATQIVVPVPSGASSGPITVTTKDGSDVSAASFYLPPAIATFLPASGLPGAAVTITGTDFTNTTGIKFNGVPAAFRVVNNNQAIATVPPTGSSGLITLTTPFGTAHTAVAFYVPPVVTGFSPGTGYIGSTVIITGYFPDGATKVLFNNVEGTITLASASQVVALVPTNATTGPITVVAPGGSSVSVDDFNVALIKMGISRLSNNSLSITWPGSAAGYVLQYVTNLQKTNLWITDTNTPQLIGGSNTVTEKSTGSKRLYRLKVQ